MQYILSVFKTNKNRILVILFLFVSVLGKAQNIQWESSLINYSSQFGENAYGAKQVLGEPNSMPNKGYVTTAWQAGSDDRKEFVHVGYSAPMKIRQVIIAESYNPGGTCRILLYDKTGVEYEILKKKADTLAEQSRIFGVVFPETAYEVVSVKVVIDCRVTPGVNQIDAIGISDSDVKFEIKDHMISNLAFYNEVEKLNENINSAYIEFAPVVSPDGKTLYVHRKNYPPNTNDDEIWISHFENGQWSKLENAGAPLNNSENNLVNSVSSHGKVVGLTGLYPEEGNEVQTLDKRVRSVKGKLNTGGHSSPGYQGGFGNYGYMNNPSNYDMYRGEVIRYERNQQSDSKSFSNTFSVAVKGKDGWSYPANAEILKYTNYDKSSNYFLAANGKVLLMNLKKSDTKGDCDLYVSFLQPDWTWSEPVNLGDDINSNGSDVISFLSADNKTLYFATDGREGLGGMDIFMSRRLDESWKKWAAPVNLGAPVNSGFWDGYFSVPASGEVGYFVVDNDIYQIALKDNIKPEPIVMLSGKVYNAHTHEPMEATVFWEALPDGNEEGFGIASEDGTYKITLPRGKEYGFAAFAPGYFSVHDNMDVTSLHEYTEVNRDLYLVPINSDIPVRMNNVFFESNNSVLLKSSFPELNRVATYLQSDTTAIVELSVHSDNSLPEDESIELTTKQALAIAGYLRSKGIPARRISPLGRGNLNLLSTESTEEAKELNRRVEFRILRKNQ